MHASQGIGAMSLRLCSDAQRHVCFVSSLELKTFYQRQDNVKKLQRRRFVVTPGQRIGDILMSI